MGIEKSKIKAGTMSAYADDLERAIVAQENNVLKLQGAQDGLKQAGKNIEGVIVRFRAELEDGTIQLPEDLGQLTKLVGGWLRRAHGVTIALADRNTAEGLQMEGRVQGLKGALKRARAIESEETAKAEALENPPEDTRPVGKRPEASVASQRKAEESAQTPPDAPKEAKEEERPKKATGAPKKRRRRRKKKEDTDG